MNLKGKVTTFVYWPVVYYKGDHSCRGIFFLLLLDLVFKGAPLFWKHLRLAFPPKLPVLVWLTPADPYLNSFSLPGIHVRTRTALGAIPLVVWGIDNNQNFISLRLGMRTLCHLLSFNRKQKTTGKATRPQIQNGAGSQRYGVPTTEQAANRQDPQLVIRWNGAQPLLRNNFTLQMFMNAWKMWWLQVSFLSLSSGCQNWFFKRNSLTVTVDSWEELACLEQNKDSQPAEQRCLLPSPHSN